MASLIPGFEYDIFISYRQKDNKGDRWVSEFVDALKTELESTFKEEISVYFDINPHDGLLETYDVEASLKEKLKSLVFIPIISRTYCDPKSFAWEHEFKAFVEQASQDQFGLKVRLPNGNVANRVLPVRIHDLYLSDINECELVLGSVLRGIEFIYREPGVNKPLTTDDDEKKNLNRTKFRIQINRTANAIREIISGLKKEPAEYEIVNEEIISFNEKPVLKGKSIIVLPFENISSELDQEYLSDGLTEEIITDLTHIKDLLVISRNSAMTFKGTNKKTAEIAFETNVRYVLEGSVRKAGNNLRITVQLIDGKNDLHIWAEKYSGTIDDVFNIQEKVSRSVVNALKLKLSPKTVAVNTPDKHGIVTAEKSTDKTAETDKKFKGNINAYNLYLRGRYFSNQHSEMGFRKGIEYFNQSINIDKNNALAYVGVARCYAELSRLSFVPFSEGYPIAKKTITKAIELNNSLGVAYATLGSLKMTMDWDIYCPESDFLRALELNPGNIEIINMFTQYLTWIGKFDKGIILAKKALELDPLTPLTAFNLGFILFFAGKYKESINQLNDTLSLDPDFVWAHMYLAYNYVMKRLYDKAVTYADKTISIWSTENKSIPLGFMAWVYGKSGCVDKALELLSQLHAMKSKSSFDPYCMAIAYSGLNERDKALEWLSNAYEAHSGLMLYVKVHSQNLFKNLNSDRRYNQLLNKVGYIK